jgi:DNA integrity scanning protein DisA with diadenylate cyclase activity
MEIFMNSFLLTIQNVFLAIQPKDVFDILIVAFLIYAFLALLKQTHAYFILAGLLILLGLYFISKN